MKFNDPLLATLAAQAEVKYKLPAGVLDAIRLTGEQSDSDMVSSADAKGVYQFIPSTWAAYAGKADPTDAYASTEAAAKYMQDLLIRYGGNMGAALAEYNGGINAAKRYVRTGDPGIKETRNYVARTLKAITARKPVEYAQEMPDEAFTALGIDPQEAAESGAGQRNYTAQPLNLGDFEQSALEALGVASEEPEGSGLPEVGNVDSVELDSKIRSLVESALDGRD